MSSSRAPLRLLLWLAVVLTTLVAPRPVDDWRAVNALPELRSEPAHAAIDAALPSRLEQARPAFRSDAGAAAPVSTDRGFVALRGEGGVREIGAFDHESPAQPARFRRQWARGPPLAVVAVRLTG